MDTLIHTHTWQERNWAGPAVLTAHEVVGEYPLAVHRILSKRWVLDYEFSSYGRCRVSSKRSPWKARPPRTAHLYPPGTVYWEDTREERGRRHSGHLCFSGTSVGELARLTGNGQEGYADFVDAGGRLGDVIHRAAQIGYRLGEAGFWQAQALLCEALDLILRADRIAREVFRIPAAETPSDPSEFVTSVERLLNDRLAERVTLPEIAAHVNMSLSSLSHKYRERTGETPLGTHMRLRINHAKALLLKGLSVKFVADRLGFCDAYHLSKSFKRVEGCSPRTFLRNEGSAAT